MRENLFIGLISGTSMDGIDAALVSFDDSGTQHHGDVLETRCEPYAAELRARLERAVANPAAIGLAELGALDTAIAQAFAGTARALLQQAGRDPTEIAAIGSHGQTVLHAPDPPEAFSLQLGRPAGIAVQTGITTIGDFRNADIAAGGQGAPLAPAFHHWAFANSHESRAVLNLGGIANLTLLPATGDVTGFDSGPANNLLDGWARTHLQQPFDQDGQWSAGGRVCQELLNLMLQEPYFGARPPKSTGPELFNLAWLQRHLDQLAAHSEPIAARDVQASLAELTATTVADALRRTPGELPAAVAVCGGGARNLDLLQRLRAQLPGVRMEPTDAWGIAAEWVEAVAFAWLARERLAGRPNNLPTVTGASRSLSLGSVCLP